MSASVFLLTISLKRGSGLRCNTAQQEAATERKGIKKQKAEEVETPMPSTRGHDWCWLWYHSHALSLEERKCHYVSSFFAFISRSIYVLSAVENITIKIVGDGKGS